MGAGISKHDDEIRAEALESKSVAQTFQTATAEAAATPENADAAPSESGCPMKKRDGSYSIDWGAMFRAQFPHGPGGKLPLDKDKVRERTGKPTEDKQNEINPSGGCPVQQSESDLSGGCPVKHKEYNVYSQPLDPKNNMPSVANQLRAPGQTKSLSTNRVNSTIPKGGANEGTTWTYPSPQMFYNALSRKGKLGDTDEDDISSVVALHNNMNEKTFSKVLEWEAVLTDGGEPPKLLKFMGRPSDLSPKAMFKHYVLGHPLPYDRHDWTILRKDGTTVRYIIDYYYDETRAVDEDSSGFPALHDVQATPSLLVDVRPALDGPVEAWNRVVTMPYARRIASSTEFEPLPMRPTEDMRSQVMESVQVWESIQVATAEKKKADDADKMPIPDISEKDAGILARNFSQALTKCRVVSEKVKNAESEMDLVKARMDLTICMAGIVCPTQHTSLVQALADQSASQDEKIETAVGEISECVYMKTGEHRAAREKYPKLFSV